jgi:hypothetical protein
MFGISLLLRGLGFKVKKTEIWRKGKETFIMGNSEEPDKNKKTKITYVNGSTLKNFYLPQDEQAFRQFVDSTREAAATKRR